MHTGENEQGLRKILDMTRLISIALLIIHFYYYCCATFYQIREFRSWLITHELEKNILFNKIDEIKNNIQKMGEKWLQ